MQLQTPPGRAQRDCNSHRVLQSNPSSSTTVCTRGSATELQNQRAQAELERSRCCVGKDQFPQGKMTPVSPRATQRKSAIAAQCTTAAAPANTDAAQQYECTGQRTERAINHSATTVQQSPPSSDALLGNSRACNAQGKATYRAARCAKKQEKSKMQLSFKPQARKPM